MTPPDWTAYRRTEDDELLGYLQGDADATTPLTVFGFPLSGPTSRARAEEVLRRRGLSVLAEPWWLVEEDGSAIRVQIMAAYPDEVVVARADYGFVPPDAERWRLGVPVGERLRPLSAA